MVKFKFFRLMAFLKRGSVGETRETRPSGYPLAQILRVWRSGRGEGMATDSSWTSSEHALRMLRLPICWESGENSITS